MFYSLKENINSRLTENIKRGSIKEPLGKIQNLKSYFLS